MKKSVRKMLWLVLSITLSCAPFAFFSPRVTWAEPGTGTDGDPAVEAGAALPPGYSISVVTTRLNLPTDMALLPNGDFLVTQKGSGVDLEGVAQVRLVQGGVLQVKPALSLSVGIRRDSGLMSIALDPNFAENHYLYLWYAVGRHARHWTGQRTDRLSRFRYDADKRVIDPSSEAIILEGVTWSEFHNGGGLLFDSAGNLLITTGEGGGSLVTPSTLPQDMASLNGKVLRIHPERSGYSIPDDNPYVGVPGVRPEIYASGLRNPFRIAERQSDGNVFIADVGDLAWEEVDLLRPKANYGWPVREGPCPLRIMILPCAPTPAQYTDPVLYYSRAAGAALSALAFVEPRAFPADMRGKLLYADFIHQTISAARLTADGFTIEPFASNVGRIVDMEMTDDGLYLLDIGHGRILFIEYAGGSNQAPVAKLAATPTLGRAPLTVAFSAAGSTDDDNFGLRYRWEFGDGSQPVTTTIPTITRRYAADGNYAAKLTVIDRFGAKSETLEMPITVYSGALPQIVLENLTEPGRALYHGGDRFRYRVERSNGTQGLDTQTPFLWSVELLHDSHAHRDIVDFAASEGEYEIPVEAHDLNARIHYRFLLTMKTASGIEVEVARDLEPQYAGLFVDTWPQPKPVRVNGAPVQPGSNVAAIVGERYVLQAPLEMVYQDSISEFAYWLVDDGWPLQNPPAAETEPQIWYTRTVEFTVPISDTAIVAYYARSRPMGETFMPIMRN